MPSNSKTERWNLRVASDEDGLVRAAAALTDAGLTTFIRSAAVNEAERVLADRSSFALDPEGWDAFNEALDRPPRVPPGLERLFSRPSAFDE